MNNVAIKILLNVLKKIDIPKKDWNIATGNACQNKGKHWFACSHYRPELDRPGCAIHHDTGFITVLYIEEPGLEAFINNKWHSINPIQGHFIINFGYSFEVLTKNLNVPIKSILHKVRKVKKDSTKDDRFSFASFTNIPPELDMYQYDQNKNLQFYQSVEKFLEEFNKEAWDDKYGKSFGLTS